MSPDNPKDVAYDDAVKVAGWLGFGAKGGKVRHSAFSRKGEPTGLNFQPNKNGKIPSYQAKQLIEMIEKYGEDT